jgi:hypothetical protein
MGEKKSWDDIPSLDGLSVDWEFEPENELGKRGHMRISGVDLAHLFSWETMPIKIGMDKRQHNAKIFNLSEGGLAVQVKEELPVDKVVLVGFFLGKKKIVNRAVVRWSSKVESHCLAGMKFQKMKEEDSEYISGVYASHKIRRF